jgi:CheY-like chemotaxis protein
MSPAANLTGVRVLVVEDHGDSRSLFTFALAECGASVAEAASVEEARRLLPVLQPQVVVSDLTLPDDGEDVLNLAKRVHNEGIPVIAVTAHHERGEELRGAGFAEIVGKPVDVDALCRIVQHHAERPSATDQPLH